MLEEFLNKNVKVVFTDGTHVQIREGKVLSISQGFLVLEGLLTGSWTAISLKKIHKVEAI